jgi:hypothetical protein
MRELISSRNTRKINHVLPQGEQPGSQNEQSLTGTVSRTGDVKIAGNVSIPAQIDASGSHGQNLATFIQAKRRSRASAHNPQDG